MPYAIYPAGLRDAIEDVSSLGVPIYITETGVADKGDELRPVVIQTYFEQVCGGFVVWLRDRWVWVFELGLVGGRCEESTYSCWVLASLQALENKSLAYGAAAD